MASELEILVDITMMLVVASVCTLVLSRLKMPTIIGYLLAGFLLGPNILPEYIIDQDLIAIFSSMGIILLMFFIGIELNLRGLRKVASVSLLIAAGEMTMMILLGYSLGIAFGLDPSQAVFLGIIMSVASTAAVLTVMPGNKHLTNDDRRAITGILVMEDLGLVIVLTLAGPVIGGGSVVLGSVLEMVVGIVIFITMSILLGVAVVPRLLDAVRSRYSDEVLFLVALALAFAMALVSNMVGLSVAVGAFIMGVIVSESACAATVCSKVEPMKELFIATFFISVGFQFDPSLFAQGILFAAVIALVFVAGKLLFVSSACYLANFNARSCLFVAASLAAMGEFSFLVAKIALDGGLIDHYIYSSVIGAALFTLVAMPLISRGAPRLVAGLVRHFPDRMREDMEGYEERRQDLEAKAAVMPQFRKEVRKELLFIVVDLVLIASMLIAVNLLSVLRVWIDDIGADLGIVPSVMAFFLALMLTLPLIFILVARLKKLSHLLASAVRDPNHLNRRRSAAGRVFKDLGEAFLALLLFLLFLPFLPQVEGMGFLPFLALCLLAVVFSYLIWDAYKAAYKKVSSSIARGFSDDRKEGPD